MNRASPNKGKARPGAIGIAAILVLVILQLMVVGFIVTGSREQDMMVLRMDTVRSQYALDSASHMALREIYRGVDEDSDGTIGSIAGGVIANGPLIGTARAAATLTSTGTTYTLVARASAGSCTRATSVGVDQGAGSADPITTYGAVATSTSPTVQLYSSGSWGSASNTTALSSTVAWQTIRVCPINVSTPARSIVTLTQDRVLSLTSYASGAWGSPSTLTSDTGTPNTKVFAAEYEYRSGNLMTVYRKSSGTTLYYRTYTTSLPAEQSFSLGLSGVPTWMEIAAEPSSNELVLVVSEGSRLSAGVWNGSSWGNSTLLESSLSTTGRPFHVAYMNRSGTAMVVWTATSGVPKYKTWNGSSWSSTGTLPAIGGSSPAGWIKLEGSPLRSSDAVLFACIGTNNQINVNNWTGSAWGTNTVIDTSAAANNEPRVDLAFQPDGATGLVVWHTSGQNSLRYRTWSGSAWSSQQTGPNMTSETESIRLVRGANSNVILMLARRAGSAGYAAYNVYSENGTITTGTTVVSGTTGSSGTPLPTAPSVTAGSTNLNPSSGTTISPGSYGTLTVDDNTTVNFIAGTYTFSSWSMDNSATYNFNTSAGPITVNITTGDLDGKNTATFTNSGGAPVRINVIGGDVKFKNDTTFTNIEMIVYNGKVEFKNNTNGTLDLSASGNIKFKNNGVLSPNGIDTGMPGLLSAVLWTNGSPGTRTDLCTAVVAAGVVDPCDLAPSPLSSSPAMSTWASVEP